jgi:hypothetical protein
MIKRLALALLLLTSCSLAFAASPKESGGYIEGGFGTTSLEDDGAFAGYNFDNSDSGFGLAGGYKFFKHLAVEGRYTDFGTFSLGGVPFDVTAVSIHVIGIIPFGESGWELFGQLGLGSADLTILGESVSENVGSAGLGIRYSISENFSLGLRTDAYAYEDTSFGRSYDISASQTAITLKYVF